ncbi:MAG: hypothetical protein H0U84_01545 [Thermoleophilaceae bacterium]|nr:hypothetical protein [Thermoleophilaceae bacterium]
MPTELPIACSLSATELRQRLADMRAIGRAALVSSEATDAQAVLRFRRDEQTLAALGDIVAAERECCAFLSLDLTNEPDAVVLTIRAPDGAEPVAHELVAAFRSETEAVV